MQELELIHPKKRQIIKISENDIFDIGKNVSNVYSGKKVILYTDNTCEKRKIDLLAKSFEKAGFTVKLIHVKLNGKIRSLSNIEDIYNKMEAFDILDNVLIVSYSCSEVNNLLEFMRSQVLEMTSVITVPSQLMNAY